MSTSSFSTRLAVRRLAVAPLAAALALGTTALIPAPAAAQYYSPYYDGPPPYYAPPRAYRYVPPDYQPFGPQDVRPMLRSMGFGAIGTPRVDGRAFVVDATDGDGVRLRVRINRASGRVVSMRPLGGTAERALVPPANVKLPPKKPPLPQTAALPPPAPGENPPGAGLDGPPSAAAPQPGPQGSDRPVDAAKPADVPPPAAAAKPAETAKPVETAKPATESAKPAEPAKPASPDRQAAVPPAGDAPVRVIPGVAGPKVTPQADAPAQATPAPAKPAEATPAAPARPAPPVVGNAKAGTGAGTGTPAGSVSAGTASVLARDAGKKPAEPKPSSN